MKKVQNMTKLVGFEPMSVAETEKVVGGSINVPVAKKAAAKKPIAKKASAGK